MTFSSSELLGTDPWLAPGLFPKRVQHINRFREFCHIHQTKSTGLISHADFMRTI